MADSQTAIQELSARGITTLEQFVEGKSRMRKPQRIKSTTAVEAIFARASERSASSFKSKIGQPSVPLVLDGKRVEYNEIARLNGQPLDYVATRLKGGERALVAFSDRSIMRNHFTRQFDGVTGAINHDVEKALMASGLQAFVTPRSIALGLEIFEDSNYGGDSTTLAPNDYVPDLTEFDDGIGFLGGDWNDRISSMQMGRCYCQAWEDINEGGATINFTHDEPDLGVYGWDDVISGIWAVFSN